MDPSIRTEHTQPQSVTSMNAECSTVVVLGEGAHAPAMEAPDWLDSTEAAPATPSPPELGLGATMPVREPHAGAEAPTTASYPFLQVLLLLRAVVPGPVGGPIERVRLRLVMPRAGDAEITLTALLPAASICWRRRR
jgi:hypothetical protein